MFHDIEINEFFLVNIITILLLLKKIFYTKIRLKIIYLNHLENYYFCHYIYNII